MATRDELARVIETAMAAFRAAREQVEATEAGLERAFATAHEDDQCWFVGKVMAGMGEIVAETPTGKSRIAALIQAAETGPVH